MKKRNIIVAHEVIKIRGVWLNFEESVFSDEVFRLFVIRQQAVYQFVAYGHFSSFEDEGSFLQLDRLHKI